MPTHYPYLVDPTVYPDFKRRKVRAPTWETFNHATQLTVLRCFTIKDNRLVNWREDLELYTQKFKLGKIIWPIFQTVFAENFKDLVQEIKRQKYYLFDIWGHVPGNSQGSIGGNNKTTMWGHLTPPDGMVDYLEKELGNRFLGFDNGEQDGRYVGVYACQQCPSFSDRFRQYLNFQRHFERMGDDLGNNLSTLVSLCFGHYFLKEGNHVLIGAETAQCLPNSQVYYAFIRGAGKQYGIHWFGNASIWNFWGYKNYEGQGCNYAPEGHVRNYGPKEGASLNLLRRLIYTHILYNCVAVGFENGWITQDNVEKRMQDIPVAMEINRDNLTLSPIGEIQASAAQFLEKHGQPGVMHTPVALLLDFFSGWTMPRNVYSDYIRSIYQVWGNMPYAAGDYLTHGVLSKLYPGYEDSGYFKTDERGFLTATPYGDMTDCLLSDAPAWVLRQYGLLVAAGELNVDTELRAKLEAYVARGGHLIVTAANAQKIWPEWGIGSSRQTCPAGSIVQWEDGARTTEDKEFELMPVVMSKDWKLAAACGGHPAVVEIACGNGWVTLLLSPLGVNSRPLIEGTLSNKQGEPLGGCACILLAHVHLVLDKAFRKEQIFSVGTGLGFSACRGENREYWLGIYNNSLASRDFKIESHIGAIAHIEELPLDQSAKSAEGYWPEGKENEKAGVSDDKKIAGGDIRIFKVSIRESGLRILDKPVIPEKARNRLLAMRNINDLKEAILKYPTFFQYFTGVKVDWSYLRIRNEKQIMRERNWLKRQAVRIIVDFSPGLNLYPLLTLVNTQFRYKESLHDICEVLDNMTLIGSSEAVISLHRAPEDCDEKCANERFLEDVRHLAGLAGERGIKLYLQHHPHKWHGSAAKMLEFIKTVNMKNLSFALNTGHALMDGENLDEIIKLAGNQLGLVLACVPRRDMLGQLYDAHAPLSGGNINLSPLVQLVAPLVLDADYSDWSAVYSDLHLLRYCAQNKK